MKSRRAIKIVVALALAAGLGVVFVRSARQSRAEPYKVNRAALRDWRVTIETPNAAPSAPVVALRGTPELSRNVFNQIFARAMESLMSPAMDGIVLVSRAELDAAFGGRADARALALIANEVGLGSSELQPHCLGYRRVSNARGTRQLYFLLFDSPGFVRFREKIAALAEPGMFDPAALSPAVMVAASESSFESWAPLRTNPATDCIAAIKVE